MILDGAARPRERKLSLLGSSEHFWFDVESLLDSVYEIGAIFCIARSGGGDEADALDPVARADFGVLFSGLEGAIEGRGLEAAGLVDALTQPHDLHAPLHLDGFALAGFD